MLSETTYADYTANSSLPTTKVSPAGKNFLIVLKHGIIYSKTNNESE